MSESRALWTWREVAEFMRRSIEWCQYQQKYNGMPVMLSTKGGGPWRRVFTTTGLLENWAVTDMNLLKNGSPDPPEAA